jgi:hypothetical protein
MDWENFVLFGVKFHSGRHVEPVGNRSPSPSFLLNPQFTIVELAPILETAVAPLPSPFETTLLSLGWLICSS